MHEGAAGPPKSEHVLEGIRYDLLRELWRNAASLYNLRPISEAEVLAADEILPQPATKRCWR